MLVFVHRQGAPIVRDDTNSSFREDHVPQEYVDVSDSIRLLDLRVWYNDAFFDCCHCDRCSSDVNHTCKRQSTAETCQHTLNMDAEPSKTDVAHEHVKDQFVLDSVEFVRST